MKRLTFCFFWLTMACTQKNSNCVTTTSTVLRNFPDKVYIATYNADKSILGISDKGTDSTRGAYYFYKSGILRSYKHFQKSRAFNYEENFDENGKLVETKGKVLVDKLVDEINFDSAFIQIYFFSLHKDCDKVDVDINHKKRITARLDTDSIYSNMKVASFGINTKDLHELTLYFHLDYDDNCLGVRKIVVDTLRLIKNPRLNFTERSRQYKPGS